MIYLKQIKELVDKDGTKISGPDGSIDNDDIKSTSNSTTDDFVRTSRQGVSSMLYRRFWGESEDEVVKPVKQTNKVSKEKMKSVLEDIFSKQVFDKDLVMKSINDLNSLPNIDSLEENHPIIVKKVKLLKEIINSNNLSGDETAIIINFLLDGVGPLSYDYKNMLKRKLK
jgi:hypothetical protein